MSMQSQIDHLVNRYDNSDFDPYADAADGATVGMVMMKDMRDALERLSELLCRHCEGNGFIQNPHVRYTEDTCDGRYTGAYSTNDPEEIDCPTCGGVGFLKPTKPTVQRMPQTSDGEIPF